MNRGFIQIPILIAILVGMAIFGGAGYLAYEGNQKSQNQTQEQLVESVSEASIDQTTDIPTTPDGETNEVTQIETTIATPTTSLPVISQPVSVQAPVSIVADTDVTTPSVAPVVAPTPKVKITANPSSVEYGSTSVINWVATDALLCTLGTSPVLLSVTGSQSISPTDSSKDWKKSDKRTHTITCTSAGGSVSEDVTVTVQPWEPSADCQKDYENKKEIESRIYHNEMTPINPTFCSKMEM